MSGEQGKPTKRAKQARRPGGERRGEGATERAPRTKPAPSAPAKTATAETGTPPGTTLGTKISASLGIIAAMMLAVVANVLVARHYTRWDWTRGGLYTLSDATVQTLRSLEEPITVFVLLPGGDPLGASVLKLLEAYRAETTRLTIKPTDPDRYPAEFLAVQQRFGIVAGKTVDGRIMTDAQVIVARGDVPHFLTSRDLVEIEDEEDLRARPRLEQAITGAIRSVLGGERPKACFTTGHGERSIDVGGSGGVAPLRDRLVKNNYEVVAAAPAKPLGGARGDDGHDGEEREEGEKVDLATCRVLIMAGPTQPVPPEDVARYRAYIERGGSALLAIGQEPDATEQGYVDLGVADLLALAGVRLEQDFVFELDPKQRSTQGFGETFAPTLKPHPITEGLLRNADTGLAVVVTMANSLSPVERAAAAPVPLLVTSDQAFGMTDFFAWAKSPTPPVASGKDHKGPLTIAVAAELPKPAGSSAPHGPRIVAVGSAGVILGANWQVDELKGTALFVESAITWLAARPVMLDIPNKPSFTAGLRISEEAVGTIFRSVVIYMPLVAALLGIAMYFRRRGGERREDRKVSGPARGEGSGDDTQDPPSAPEGA